MTSISTTSEAFRPWGQTEKLGFRFAFLFLILYVFPFPIGYHGLFGFLEPAVETYSNLRDQLVVWHGRVLLGIDEVRIGPTGSGDTALRYLTFMVVALYAVLGTLIWSVVDRNRSQYVRLQNLFVITARYWLAFMMLSYGWAKVFHLQFSPMWSYRLTEPIGNLSPMGLVWLFMSYSEEYNWLTGGAEALGGLLLLFRRTHRLGALVIIAVMVNVTALNLFYDVPVKIMSMLYLGLAIGLAWPALQGMYRWMILQKPLEPIPTPSVFKHPKWKLGANIIKGLVVAWVLYFSIDGSVYGQRQYGKYATPPPLEGIWEAQTFVVNGDTIPPLWTDTVHWRYWAPVFSTRAMIQYPDNSRQMYTYIMDTARAQHFVLERDSLDRYAFSYTLEQDSLLHLSGFYRGDTLEIDLTHTYTEDYSLTNREFNWVQEFPYNR